MKMVELESWLIRRWLSVSKDLDKHLLEMANAMCRTVDAYHTLIMCEQDMTKARKDDLDSRLNITQGWWRVLAAGLTDEDCTHTSPYRIDSVKHIVQKGK